MSETKKRGGLFLIVVGIIAGIVLWGGFNTAMEMTNTETFCISCHEMEQTVYQELQETVHFTNRTGVRATCPDCHVPKEWIHKFVRKIQATNELYHKMLGTIDTPEKFEEKRLELAENVWRSMKKADSRECRNCHKFVSMDLDKQGHHAARNSMTLTIGMQLTAMRRKRPVSTAIKALLTPYPKDLIQMQIFDANLWYLL